jgi:hypothetical protein
LGTDEIVFFDRPYVLVDVKLILCASIFRRAVAYLKHIQKKMGEIMKLLTTAFLSSSSGGRESSTAARGSTVSSIATSITTDSVAGRVATILIKVGRHTIVVIIGVISRAVYTDLDPGKEIILNGGAEVDVPSGGQLVTACRYTS